MMMMPAERESRRLFDVIRLIRDITKLEQNFYGRSRRILSLYTGPIEHNVCGTVKKNLALGSRLLTRSKHLSLV